MSYEEAIQILRQDLHETVPKSAVTAREHNEAILWAIEALGKQIPRKPDVKKLPKKAGYSDTCPSCVHKTEHYEAKTGVSRWQNYCHQCGQALDWSEVEFSGEMNPPEEET